MLQRWFPGLGVLRGYHRTWLRSDVLAGVSVAAIQIPTAIAYAELAGFSPVVGLYSSVLPLVAYALLGSSRQLIVGPDSATCAMVAAALLPLAADNPQKYAGYSAVLALMVGLLSVLGGVARLGFIANFLARPILAGFLNGVGLTIVAGQLGKLCGISLVARDFFPQLWEVASRLGETHWPSLAVGLAIVAVVVALKRLAPRIPGPLAGVVLGGALVLVLDLIAQGVRVVGEVPQGLPALQAPSIEPADLRPLAVAAMGIAVMSFCSAMLTARSFAARNRYEIDANGDFIALGVANLTAGLSQGFVISGADSRTAVNDAVGGKTQLTGVFAAVATAAVVLFFTAPLRYVPIPALAAVLIVAGVGLLDGATLRRLRAVSPFEYRLSLVATLGVLTVGVLPGILVAVALAIVKLLILASRPGEAILGELPDQEGYHDVAGQPGARTVPGLVIYRFDAAPLFFNADYFKERVRAVVAAAPERPKWFLYSAEAANVADFTGAEAIEQIRAELAAQGIVLAIARPRGLFEVMLRRTGLAERIGATHLFPTVRSAVQAYLERQPPASAPV